MTEIRSQCKYKSKLKFYGFKIFLNGQTENSNQGRKDMENIMYLRSIVSEHENGSVGSDTHFSR